MPTFSPGDRVRVVDNEDSISLENFMGVEFTVKEYFPDYFGSSHDEFITLVECRGWNSTPEKHEKFWVHRFELVERSSAASKLPDIPF